MTLGVRAIVSNGAGEIVLVRHTYVDGWFLPGGGVEKGETAQQSLTRELREEAGVALTGLPSLVGVFSNHRAFANDHVLLYVIAPGDWSACPSDNVGEIAEIAWIDPASPPQGTTPATARRLGEWLAARPPAPEW